MQIQGIDTSFQGNESLPAISEEELQEANEQPDKVYGTHATVKACQLLYALGLELAQPARSSMRVPTGMSL